MKKRRLIIKIIVLAATIAILFAPLPFHHSTRIENSVTIARPPEAVYTYVTTPGNWPKWHPSSLAVSGATDHSLSLGETVTEDFRVAGRTGRVVWRVVEAAAPHSWTIDGMIGNRAAGTVRYSLAARAGGTDFKREFVYHAPNLLFVVLNRLSIRAQIDAESEQAVRQLKVVLESGPGS